MRAIALCFIPFAIGGCTTSGPAASSLQPCEREHVLKRLRIQLPCEWQVERSVVGTDTIFRFLDRGNAVMLQSGRMWNSTTYYDADSSLQAGFSDRRIAGTIEKDAGASFIHGSKPLRNRGGDSLFIYLEDTSRWEYYHFDGEFLNGMKMVEFLSAVRGSELLR